MNGEGNTRARSFPSAWRPVAGRAIAVYLHVVRATGPWRRDVAPAAETVLRGGEAVIIAFHHGRFPMAPFIKGERDFTAMVSRSKDGDLIAATLQGLGVETARGSPKAGGSQAQRAILRAMAAGGSAAVAVDGPKGPRGAAKAGVAHLAALSGAPTLPFAFSARGGITARSWDRLLIPWPLLGGALTVSDPLPAPRRDAFGAFLERLDGALFAAADRADRLVGRARRSRARP